MKQEIRQILEPSVARLDAKAGNEEKADQRRIMDTILANRRSHAVAAGVRIGLFDALDACPRTEKELTQALELVERPTLCLLHVLCSIGLLTQEDGRFTLAADASQYLVRDKPGSLVGLVELEIEHGITIEHVFASLKKNNASIYDDTDPWERHEKDACDARIFTAAMHSISEAAADGLTQAVDLSAQTRVLDVGGGSGALSLAIARRWQQIECLILDRPAVCGLAAEYIAHSGLEDRVRVREFDMFSEPFPEGFDTILFSQILHDWPCDAGVKLFQKAYRALPPRGQVLIHEKLVSEDHTAPLTNVLVNLDMLVWTQGRQLSGPEISSMLATADFVEPETMQTTGYWSVVRARKA